MEKIEELIKKNLDELSFMNLKLFALDSQEEMKYLQEKLQSYEKLIFTQQKRIESAVLLCDCIKQNLERINSLEKQGFESLKKSDFMDSMMLTIASYIDLWLFTNTSRR